MSTMTITMSDVRQQVAALATEYHAWQESPVQQVSEVLFDCLTALESSLEAEPADVGDKRLLIEAAAVSREFAKWRDDISQDPKHPAQQCGHRDLWCAVERLEAAQGAFTIDTLPTIAELRGQRPTPVSDSQIAKMHGWRLPSGVADVSRVNTEARRQAADKDLLFPVPGWVEEAAKIEREWEELRAGQTFGQDHEAAAVIPSLDELIVQEVSIKQILKIRKDETRQSVLSRAGQLGIMLPDEHNPLAYGAEKAAAIRQNAAKEKLAVAELQTLSEVPDFGELGDRDLRVMALREKGLKPAQIAKKLATDYPGTTAAMVSTIIAQHVAPEGAKVTRDA